MGNAIDRVRKRVERSDAVPADIVPLLASAAETMEIVHIKAQFKADDYVGPPDCEE